MTAVIMLLALACTPALALSVCDAALDAALNVPDGNIQFVTEGEYPWTVDGANGWAKAPTSKSAVPNPPSRQQSRRKRAISFPLTTKSAAKHVMIKLVFAVDGNPVAFKPLDFLLRRN